MDGQMDGRTADGGMDGWWVRTQISSVTGWSFCQTGSDDLNTNGPDEMNRTSDLKDKHPQFSVELLLKKGGGGAYKLYSS